VYSLYTDYDMTPKTVKSYFMYKTPVPVLNVHVTT